MSTYIYSFCSNRFKQSLKIIEFELCIININLIWHYTKSMYICQADKLSYVNIETYRIYLFYIQIMNSFKIQFYIRTQKTIQSISDFKFKAKRFIYHRKQNAHVNTVSVRYIIVATLAKSSSYTIASFRSPVDRVENCVRFRSINASIVAAKLKIRRTMEAPGKNERLLLLVFVGLVSATAG